MKHEKLTKRQKEVMIDVCNGGMFITDSEQTGAWISFEKGIDKDDYHIHNGVFFALVNKGYIYQDMNRHFGYYPLPFAIKLFQK